MKWLNGSPQVVDEAERQQDGRNIDTRVATLEGEGAQQEIKSIREGNPIERFPLPQLSSAAQPKDASPTYYDQPVVKAPVWIWSIPTYFFVGGVAGASSTLASVVRLTGGEGMRSLVRDARWTAALGDALGSALLIHDLGKPSRFLNMLRVFRITSPMSVGSWILAGSGAANSVAALFGSKARHFEKAADYAGLVGGSLGLPLAGYTAVLVGNTAVPVWKHTRRTMPLLFLTSSASAAASLLELLPRTEPERRALKLFGTGAKIADAVAHQLVEKEASGNERVASPLKEGLSGTLWRASAMMNLASVGLSLAPGRAKWKTNLTAGLSLASSFALRWAVFQAGKKSSMDPRATFEPQRANPM